MSASRNGDGAGEVWKPVYCYQCVAGPDSHEGPGRGWGSPLESARTSTRATTIPAADGYASRPTASSRRPYNSAPRAPAHEAHESAQGPRRGPRLHAGRLGRGARRESPSACSTSAPGGLVDESGFPRLAVSFGGWRHPHPVHGHPCPPSSPPGGPIDMGFGAGQGREVLPQRAPLRRVVATARSSLRPTPRAARYVISCGNNAEASARSGRGVAPGRTPAHAGSSA